MDTKEVLRHVLDEFETFVSTDSDTKVLYRLMKSGKATTGDALHLAGLTGDKLADSLVDNFLAEMVPDDILTTQDALAVVPQALRRNDKYVKEYLAQVQKQLNQRARIGLNPLSPNFDSSRAAEIARSLTKKAIKDVAESFKIDVKTFSQHTVDRSVRANAQAQAYAGLDVRVTRIYDGVGLSNDRVCQWCLDRQGSDMTYQEAYDKGAFQRHPGCGCELLYTVGRRTQRQSDWTTNTWEDVQSDRQLEERRQYNR